MKKLNRLVLGATLIVTLVGCGAKDSQKTTESSESSAKVSIVLKEENKEFDSKEVSVKEDAVLYDVLKDNYNIEDTKGFITSIENKYWLYTINGKQAEKGVQETNVSDGDNVVFDLSKLD